MKALITGASSGIGRDMARVLSNKGYDLVLVARDEEKLNQVKQELEKNNVKVEIIVADLTSEEKCKGKRNYRHSCYNSSILCRYRKHSFLRHGSDWSVL